MISSSTNVNKPPTPKTSLPHHLQWGLYEVVRSSMFRLMMCLQVLDLSRQFVSPHRWGPTWCFEWFSGADDTNLEFMDVVAGLPLGLLWHLNKGVQPGKVDMELMGFLPPPPRKRSQWKSGELSTNSMTLGVKICNFPRSRCLVDSYAGLVSPFLSTCMWLLWTVIFWTHSTPQKGYVFFFPLLFSGLEFHLLRSSWRENVWNGSKEAQWYDTKLSNWLVGLLA